MDDKFLSNLWHNHLADLNPDVEKDTLKEELIGVAWEFGACVGFLCFIGWLVAFPH